LLLANFAPLAGRRQRRQTRYLLFRTIGCVLAVRKGALAFRFPGL
jgi:hypothetical protein